jgi:hypothetical protein
MKSNLQSIPGDKTTAIDHLSIIIGRDASPHHKLVKPDFEYRPISMKQPNLLKFFIKRIL